MRFLHTSDWHLGRLFNARSLLEDQAHVLEQFIDLARSERPDAVLIAGDVYDRAVPPPDAVALLDDVLSRLVLGLRIPVVMIAGNHDSGERLGFGARLMSANGLHVAGRAAAPVRIRFQDAAGEVSVHALPYAEPAVVRAAHQIDDAIDHAAAMQLQLEAILGAADRSPRNVLVAHAFVVGGSASESERPLSVGGSGAVGGEFFEGFDYVALGHLHRPQSFAEGRLRYAGSLMKYSLSEVEHAKSVSLVEVDRAGAVSVTEHPLTPQRDLRVLTGSLQALIEAGRIDPRASDYVHARLTDEGALLEPMARLRESYPNALSIERLVLNQAGEGLQRGQALRHLEPVDLFASFLRDVADEALDGPRQAAFEAVLADVVTQEGAAR